MRWQPPSRQHGKYCIVTYHPNLWMVWVSRGPDAFSGLMFPLESRHSGDCCIFMIYSFFTYIYKTCPTASFGLFVLRSDWDGGRLPLLPFSVPLLLPPTNSCSVEACVNHNHDNLYPNNLAGNQSLKQEWLTCGPSNIVGWDLPTTPDHWPHWLGLRGVGSQVSHSYIGMCVCFTNVSKTFRDGNICRS